MSLPPCMLYLLTPPRIDDPEAFVAQLRDAMTGGQIACLHAAAHPGGLVGIALIASCTVHYSGWPFPQNLGILVRTQTARPLVRLFGNTWRALIPMIHVPLRVEAGMLMTTRCF